MTSVEEFNEYNIIWLQNKEFHSQFYFIKIHNFIHNSQENCMSNVIHKNKSNNLNYQYRNTELINSTHIMEN